MFYVNYARIQTIVSMSHEVIFESTLSAWNFVESILKIFRLTQLPLDFLLDGNFQYTFPTHWTLLHCAEVIAISAMSREINVAKLENCTKHYPKFQFINAFVYDWLISSFKQYTYGEISDQWMPILACRYKGIQRTFVWIRLCQYGSSVSFISKL